MKLCQLLLGALEHDALLGVFGLNARFLSQAFALKPIQALEHMWFDENGLHAHLQLVASVDLVDVAEILNSLRVELRDAFQEWLAALFLKLVNLLLEFKNTFVKVHWHFEFARLVGLDLRLVFGVLG